MNLSNLDMNCSKNRKLVRQNSFPMCSSLSYACIENCNKGFWIRNTEDEAWNLWEMGKVLGVSFSGEEKGIIDRMVTLENRDRDENAKQGSAKSGGNQNVN